ncbi:unnamed protein product [Penicillium olsonii]|uniref:Major facilitator superfamily (MFS) profile domain-containing protein n=1 Tax=Penicillium olsonii TaxID=99116 RepID=A0A9W4N1F6_PENOL|nr:unnamed protein product [Penicillium olsonii]CAG8230836.1 unnamed protein product [Penicillium olsonii]
MSFVMRFFKAKSPKEAVPTPNVAAESAPTARPDTEPNACDADSISLPTWRNSLPCSEKASTLASGHTRDPSGGSVNKEIAIASPPASPSPGLNTKSNDLDAELVNVEISDREPPKEEDDDDDEKDDPEQYPSAWKLILITIALCLCVFCVALDNTIIATAIPRITDHFNSIEDVGWYGSSYLLTTCAVTLIFGKLYTFYPIKWIYLTALFVFELGSLICATTPTSVGLIIGRAIAGLGSAGLVTGSLLIISKSVPLEKRPMYISLVGSMFGIANVAGPLMGGAFTDHLTWRWCFYINLPIGGITFFFVLFWFQSPKAILSTKSFKEQMGELDLLGSLFFLPSIICLLLALQWGGSKYPWNNGRIIALFVVFGVLIIAFCAVQVWSKDKATIPPRLIKKRSVWGSVWFSLALGSAFFVFAYYLPIWFQSIKGASATKSGIMNLPTIISVVILSILSGGLTTACGYYTPFMIASPIIMSIGAGLLTTLEVDSGHAKWIGYQAIFGIGIGLGMQQPMIVAQTALKPADVPVGTAMVIFAQTLGGAIFISVAQNVFQNGLITNFAKYAPEQNAPQLISAGATMIRSLVKGEDLHQVLLAYNAAITETFYVAVAMGALSMIGPIFVEWISVKGKKLDMAPA